MLRLAPEGYYRFVQADTFGATYGGGEANVAVSLANYGFDAKSLPNSETRDRTGSSEFPEKYGVDTSFMPAAETESESTSLKKEHPRDRPRLFTTEQVLLFIQQLRKTSIGKQSSTEQNGSILQESHRRSTMVLQRSVWKL